MPHISLYNSEILLNINFITVFFRDFPFISVLDWTVAGNDRFKLVFAWLFKGNVILFLQTENATLNANVRFFFQTYIL